ncbi:MAG: NADH-quinone oxidoreductase subunit H [Planctomycetota bacterium]|nr:NADH-quinone oxidoreductase subunit H [Planctomycetota bacterium]
MFAENLVTFWVKVVRGELAVTPALGAALPALALLGLARREHRAIAGACVASAIGWTLLVSWNGNAPHHNFRYYAPGLVLVAIAAALGVSAIARARRGAPVAAAVGLFGHENSLPAKRQNQTPISSSVNSKYPFLGGIRSSAQMISYEIAMGMSVVAVFMVIGDLNLSKVVAYQGGGLFQWMVWKQPLAFFIFLIAAFAETNRLPFDLPESESELVGGYHTEYSSMKFALFFLGEYANMITASAIMVTLFFGGWTFPWGGGPATGLAGGLAHIACFLVKMMVLMALFIWVRWMFPRFRYDQLMDLGWRRFIPLALANILITALVLAALNP